MMTDKKRRFCEEYLSNGYNALSAYKVAYQKDDLKNKPSYPYTLLKDPEIKAYIDERRESMFDSLQIDSKRIITELAEIAFAEKGDEIYTTKDKIKALENLAKIMGLSITKIETSDIIDVQLI